MKRGDPECQPKRKPKPVKAVAEPARKRKPLVPEAEPSGLSSEEVKELREARQASLMEKWASGKKLNSSEKQEIAALIPEENPQSESKTEQSNASWDKDRLECERLEKQNRKLDFEHGIESGLYEKRDIMKAKWGHALEAIMDAMKAGMTREDYNIAIRRIKAKINELDL